MGFSSIEGGGQGFWQEEALCAQVDPEIFFPAKGGSTRAAKKVCLECTVRPDCLDDALGKGETEHGIWASEPPRSRRRLGQIAL